MAEFTISLTVEERDAILYCIQDAVGVDPYRMLAGARENDPDAVVIGVVRKLKEASLDMRERIYG